MSVCFLRKRNENQTLLFKRQSSSKLLVFALVMLVMQHFVLVSGNTTKGLRTHMRSAKLDNVYTLQETNANRMVGKYDLLVQGSYPKGVLKTGATVSVPLFPMVNRLVI
uniref:Uncharacterized protein n=1 Tax=Glossina brevipalpis TaxID=37001 RepID=A0A1A9WXT0_9MUSC